MNRPYSTQEPVEEQQINTVSNSKDTLVDDDSLGENYFLFRNISQISSTAASSLFKFLNQGLNWDGIKIGDKATFSNNTTDVGGVLAGYLNGTFTVIEHYFNSDFDIKGVIVDIGITAQSLHVATVNVQSSYVTPLAIMPPQNIRFFILNNRLYARYYDGVVNRYGEITTGAMTQYV